MHGWTALILAGGAGRRFDSGFGGGGDGTKLLAPLAGAPLIRRVAERIAAAGFAEVLVVSGASHTGVVAAVEGLPCRILHAADWAEGMAATLRCGIAAIAPASPGVCVFLGDMPLVPLPLTGKLIEAAARAGYAARPLVAGKPGHPVAFTGAAFADLRGLTGDQGATALLKQRAGALAYVDTDDAGALLDIDTAADLAAAEHAWNACATSATSESATARGALPKP